MEGWRQRRPASGKVRTERKRFLTLTGFLMEGVHGRGMSVPAPQHPSEQTTCANHPTELNAIHTTDVRDAGLPDIP